MEDQLRKSRPYYLPFQLSSLVGRTHEMAQIELFILKHRLVTLTGAGGVGKSRLAFEVAYHLNSEFPDGIWPVELASLADPALVPRTVANALGLLGQADTPLIERLTEYLSARELLLILDNCEHLVSGCAALVEALLLKGSPDLRLLVTSREPLGVPGEVVWHVPPLAVPPAGKGQEHPPWIHAYDIEAYDAVRLFVQRAQAALPDFSLADLNASAIAAICQHLDGLPLAIELAAARVKVLTPEQIAARLQEGLSLLSNGGQVRLSRHHTMAAAIDWSYRLLDEREQGALRRLSVFRGGWTLEAAAAVCESCAAPSDALIDLLSRLVDKSLVATQPAGHEMRYHLLETIRQYAGERLHESSEAESARRQHLAYYLALAEQAKPQLRLADYMTWLARLDAEHDNLRAALSFALERAEEAEDFAQRALRLISALEPYWYIRGHFREGLARTEKALALPYAQGPTVLRADALCAAGSLAWVQEGGIGAGQRYARESVAIWRELGPGNERGLASALRLLAAQRTSDWYNSEGRALAEESLALFRASGDELGEADALWVLGVTWEEEDDALCRTLLEESLAICEQYGDVMAASAARLRLGDICCRQGDHVADQVLYCRCLADARRAGDQRGICHALESLATSFRFAGDMETAISYYQEAINLARENGLFITRLLDGLGLCLLEQGDDRGAAALYAEVWAYGYQTYQMDALDGLAYLGHMLARVKCVRRQYRQAAQLLGAAEAARETSRVRLYWLLKHDWDRAVHIVRASMDPVMFRTACAEGRRLSGEEAMALGLNPVSGEQPQRLRTLTPLQAAKQQCGGLTAREREVAGNVADGLSNSQIADKLCVSERTVEAHMGNILSKLQFSSRTQVATWAIHKGLTAT